MANYSRPASGFRFKNLGMNTVFPPDALPEFKYPYLENIRSYQESVIQSRPGIAVTQAAPGVGAGVTLALEPVLGIYKIGSSLFRAGTNIQSGLAANLGCSIIPYRPNASPNAYDYVFDDSLAVKIATPTSGVIVQKAGIKEPQTEPSAAPDIFLFTDMDVVATSWIQGGTAAAPANGTRSTDTVTALFPDPAIGTFSRATLQVASTVNYSVFEKLTIQLPAGGPINVVVVDVVPPINAGAVLVIGSIFYFSGTTGRCVVVPSFGGLASSPDVPRNIAGDPSQQSIFSPQQIANLRRGALVKLDNEVCLVLSVEVGPNGEICFETSTTVNHAVNGTINGIAGIIISGGDNSEVGQTISSADVTCAVTAGVGTLTQTFASNPFNQQMRVRSAGGGLLAIGQTPQQNDFIHIGLNVDTLANLTEIKILFDVGDGSFTQNYFYKTIRPADISTAIANTSTQLGAAQLVAQRAIIDALTDQSADNQLDTFSSLETEPGASQWSEIIFPIATLTRVGGADNLTLANCTKMQILVNCTATVNLAFWGAYIGGGSDADVGDTNSPYFYRVRPRNSITGAIGNPSPATRYGVSPRRQDVQVNLPSAAYDSQIDTWDVFRIGGSVNTWRYVGSGKSTDTTYFDNFADIAIANSQLLQKDRFEPFPSIGPPISASSATIVGFTMQATFPTAAANPSGAGTLGQLGQLLPGNVINIGQQVFTLQTRPVFVSTGGGVQTYLFQLIENAGTQTNPSVVLIQEPALANQGSKAVFGPDSNGVLFAIQAGAGNNSGVGLRAGLVQWTNPSDPDSASDGNTADLCPPTEPLLNGWVVADTPIVMSANHAWRGFSGEDASGNLTYNFRGIPVARGLSAQFGICSDGAYIYYVAEDSIRRTVGGADESLTDDLYNLFPHEGVQGSNVVYGGQTVFAPAYQFAQSFRLAVVNNFLYFDYLDSGQNQRTLVLDIAKMAWSIDSFVTAISIHAGTTLPPSNNQAPATAALNQELFLADTTGAIYNELLTAAENVAVRVITREEMVGDIRANKMFGDAALDMTPNGGNVTVTPIFLGTVFGTSTTITGGVSGRPASPPTINLGGEQLQRSMGLKITWTDNAVQSRLFMWQIAYLTQPEDISNRIGDWDSAGVDGNKFFQGFILESDTLNAAKNISIRNGDTLAIQQTFTVTANGQQQQAFSFTQPFSAHLVRYEPDSAIWRMFNIRWIFQPTPEAALNWITQPTGHGQEGFQQVPFVNFAYNAPATVTLKIIADGIAVTVTLPATTGFQKVPVRIPPNKGQVYQYSATSTSPFQVWEDDIEILIGPWGRNTPLKTVKLLGSTMGAEAKV